MDVKPDGAGFGVQAARQSDEPCALISFQRTERDIAEHRAIPEIVDSTRLVMPSHGFHPDFRNETVPAESAGTRSPVELPGLSLASKVSICLAGNSGVSRNK